jgi:hypothetical protein
MEHPMPDPVISDHFDFTEVFPARCNIAGLAVPYAAALANARYLARMVLEPWRARLGSALGVNSWARDVVHNAALATDPASAARVAKRAGPHCDGSAADLRIIAYDHLPGTDRDAAYRKAFALLREMALAGLPVRRGILELSKPLEGAAGAGRPSHVTHIHVQATEGRASGVFVVRDWTRNAAGVWIEVYRTWTPGA